MGRARAAAVSITYDCMTRSPEEVRTSIRCGVITVRQQLVASGLPEGDSRQATRLAVRLLRGTALDHARDLTPRRLAVILKETFPPGEQKHGVSAPMFGAELGRVLSAMVASGAEVEQLEAAIQVHTSWIGERLRVHAYPEYLRALRLAIWPALSVADEVGLPSLADHAIRLLAQVQVDED